jgi:hypothetical protein
MDRSKHIGHHVCICVFFSNPVSVERSVVSSILDIFTSSFNVNLKSARRDGGPKSSARIENREWFLNAVDTMHRESNMDDVAFADDSLDRSRDARLLWSFSVDYRRKWMQSKTVQLYACLQLVSDLNSRKQRGRSNDLLINYAFGSCNSRIFTMPSLIRYQEWQFLGQAIVGGMLSCTTRVGKHVLSASLGFFTMDIAGIKSLISSGAWYLVDRCLRGCSMLIS